MHQYSEQESGVVGTVVFDIVAELYTAKGGQRSETKQFTHLKLKGFSGFFTKFPAKKSG
jgi:hypothetical protein